MIVRDATRIVGALVAVARLKRCTGLLALAAEPVFLPPIITNHKRRQQKKR